MELAKTLEPAALDPPCGPSLKGTLEWAEFERVAAGKPAKYVGPTLVAPAEEPRWPDVISLATDLLTRSKDLRIAVHLVKASLRTRGWQGLAEGLGLVRQLVERYWDQLHPELDRDDNNDPTLRLNCLADLSEDDAFLTAVRSLPLVMSPRAGKFGLKDIVAARANGQPANPKQPVTGPTPALVAAAFSEAELPVLTATGGHLHAAAEQLDELERIVGDRVGPSFGLNLGKLKASLAEADRLLAEQVALRQPPGNGQSQGANGSANGANGGAAGMTETNGAGGPVVVAVGAIRGREDVMRTLDAICEYYRVNEPSSPIPLLLRRARRLVTKDFLEILQDLAPAGVKEAQGIRGPEDAKS
jgi:type VI secretion system protein ImpA